MLEAQLTDATLVFDGNVLELFQITPEGSSRYLRRFLPALKAEGGFLYFTHPDRSVRPYGYPPEEEAAVQALIAAVAAARPADD
jgi:hypothetical protein